MSDSIELENAAGRSTVFQWSTIRPQEPGWYWFRVGDDSPKGMTRLVEAIVYLGRLSNGLRCVLPIGNLTVDQMGGEFAGPIPAPSY